MNIHATSSLIRPDSDQGELRVESNGHSSPRLIVCVPDDVSGVDLPALLHPARGVDVVYARPVPLERPCGARAVRGLPRLMEGAHVRLRVVRAYFGSGVLRVLVFIQLDEVPPAVRRYPCFEAGLAVVADMGYGDWQEGGYMM